MSYSYVKPSRWNRFKTSENILLLWLRIWWMALIDFMSIRRTKQCRANYYPGHRCKQYTLDHLCKEHRRSLPTDCAGYHMEKYIKYWDEKADQLPKEHPMKHKAHRVSIILLTELRARLAFRNRYSITMDSKHLQREQDMEERIRLANIYELNRRTNQIAPVGTMLREEQEARDIIFNRNRDDEEEAQMQYEAALYDEYVENMHIPEQDLELEPNWDSD